MIKIAVSGADGKMGGRIINLAVQDKDFQLTAVLEQKGHSSVGKEICGLKITDDPEVLKDADCLIEFTNPLATLEHLNLALKYKKPTVIGTTGLTSDQRFKIEQASKVIPIIYSPNMSIGVNILFSLVELAGKNLPRDYSVNIAEAHHIHKKDSPSGTAKILAEIIKQQGGSVKDIKSIREGEIIGDHRVIFESPVDRIELFHSARTRDIFVQGALRAAKWIVNRQLGLYNMQDVLRQ